jgi:dTMP kinase
MAAQVSGTSFSGTLIVVEGIDGCGKTEFAQLFLQWCAALHVLAKETRFPRYDTPTGEEVAKYLAGELGNPNPWRAAWLYAVDRRAAKGDLEDLLKRGYLVLANRYDISNAFQWARVANPFARSFFILAMSTLERGIFGIPKPDLVIYLKMPAEMAYELKRAQRAKEGASQDILERDLEYQKRVAQVYDDLFEASQKDWLKVSCVSGDSLLKPEVIFGWASSNPKLYFPMLKLGVKNLLLEAGGVGLTGDALIKSFPEKLQSFVSLVLSDLCLSREVEYGRMNQTYYLGKGKGR